MKRVISVWLPTLATDRIERQRRHAATEAGAAFCPVPLVTVAPVRNAPRVICANREAQAAGIGPGRSLADARVLLPEVEVLPADADGDAAGLMRLADWSRRYTPWTTVDGPDGLWLEITGCAHLFGGEPALLRGLLGRLAGAGFKVCAAVADTPGAAWAVARYGVPKGRSFVTVPPDRAWEAIAPLPLAALRLPVDAVEGLARVGLRRIGDLYPVARAPLAARYGAAVTLRLDQALGRLDEPLSPRPEIDPYAVRIAFAEPVGRPEDIAAAARQLLDRICARLADDRHGVRQARLLVQRVDGTQSRVAIGTSRPTREADHLFRLLREKLDQIDPGFGLESLSLEVATDPLAATQVPLEDEVSTTAPTPLAPLLDRLGNRLGAGRVRQPEAVESHLPERAARSIPAAATASAAAGWDRYRTPDGPPPRPPRLLAQPWPVEAVAPVPDGPPALFRWRGQTHRVAAAEGPERIAPEWWLRDEDPSPESETRDYYRIEDTDGRRFWLFRAGLYHAGAPPRWYLHGIYA